MSEKDIILIAIQSRIAKSKMVGFDPFLIVINPNKHVFADYTRKASLSDSQVKEYLGLRVIYDEKTPDFFLVDNRS